MVKTVDEMLATSSQMR
ncbi:hypothetical protein [Sphingomonas sediminicola]